MLLHQFVLVLERPPSEQQAKGAVSEHRDLYLAPGEREVIVQRRASSLNDALVSAVHNLEETNLTPVRVCAGDWVTLADIGQRIQRSRELVRLWSIDHHGPGGFPPPLNPGRDTKFYSWTEVSGWLRQHTDVELPLAQEPVLVVANLLLQARRLAPLIRDRNALGSLVGSYLSDGLATPLPVMSREADHAPVMASTG